MTENIVQITNLQVSVQDSKQPKAIIKGIDILLPKGEIVGIVGESGSGKSVTMKSVLSILPDTFVSSWDEFLFDGQELSTTERMPVSMIFQDPMTSLNPLRTVGYHLVEVIQRFHSIGKKEAEQLAVLELEKVGIPDPIQRMKQFPFELSGGMRQRVMIAMALATKPKLLIADEPTTALDVTIQAQILATIRRLQKSEQLSVALVTHDFGVVAGMCDRIIVMYQGKIVEEGLTEELFENPQHPYTIQLLNAARVGEKGDDLSGVDYRVSEGELKKVWITPTHAVWKEVEEWKS